MTTAEVMVRSVSSPRSGESDVPVIDESGAVVGVVSRENLLRAFAVDHLLARRIDDLLRDHYTARWQVQAVDGLVTISGTFQNAERWSLMALMRLVPGVEGLVLHATGVTGIRLD